MSDSSYLATAASNSGSFSGDILLVGVHHWDNGMGREPVRGLALVPVIISNMMLTAFKADLLQCFGLHFLLQGGLVESVTCVAVWLLTLTCCRALACTSYFISVMLRVSLV